MRILYIEDSTDNHFLIGFYLKEVQVELDCVETTDLAVSKLLTETYDLILLDWNLPGSISSLALLKQIKNEERTSAVPVWIISAMQNQEIQPHIQSFKDVTLFRKPIRKPEFLKRILESFPHLA